MGPFEGYASRWVPAAGDGKRFEVLSRAPEGPAGPTARAIVLHEVPGATPALERFADELVAAGIEVHVPLLFGRTGKLSLPGMVRGAVCLWGELAFFTTGRTGRLATWLRGLVDELALTDAPGTGDVTSGTEPAEMLPVGIVGMCMTGGIVLAAMAHPRVGAVVASQPSLPAALPLSPHHVRSDLGIDAVDREAAEASGTPVTCLRFRDDWRCPDERMEAMVATFGTAPGSHERDGRLLVSSYGQLTVIEVDGKGHAVLTGDREPAAVARVVGFLQASLAAG
jgi:dienelactone hydrolase